MPNTYTTLLVETSGPIATVTLNRPEVYNVINAQCFDDLEAAFNTLIADSSIRVIIVTGSGEKAFAAGADIKGLVALDGNSGLAFSQRGQHVFNLIDLCPKPVIAAINGVALGGGLELALACTLRIASDTAKLGLPEARLGLIPGYGGTQRLARLVGRSAALHIVLTANPVPATEALRLGLINELVPAADLHARAQELAETIASLAPLAVTAALRALPTDLTEGLTREAQLFANLCATTDKNRGVSAFLNKTKPTWTGN